MTIDFDREYLIRPPKLDVPGAVVVGIALLKAIPKPANPSEKRAAHKLRAALLVLQAAWKERDRRLSAGKVIDPKASDLAVDTAWGALDGRLEALASLPWARYPRAEQAAKMRSRLFPTGLKFLSWAYPSEWAQSQHLLQSIDEDNLAPNINDLAGPEFLEEIRRTHADYTVAVHGTLQGTNDQEPIDMASPLRAVAKAVGAYCTQIVASVEDEDDEAQVSRALTALQVIETYRNKQARRSAASKDRSEPDALPAAGPESAIPEVPTA